MAESIPAEVIERANRQSRRLRELLHAPEILVMPGAYDTLSALLFESLGFPAVQGSSGGINATFGLVDGEVLPRPKFIEVYQRMVAAVQVPVNADGVRGYGGPDEVAETVRLLIAAGAAGMNLEDSQEHGPGEPMRLLPIPDYLAKVDALLETKRALGSEFFLNARVDAYLLDESPARKLDQAIQRGNAYAERGADCIFYIGVGDAETIATLVREVRAPVSILAGATCPGVRELEELGVARVSYGVSFARASLTPVKALAEVLLAKGDPASLLNQSFPRAELLPLLRDRPLI